MIADRVRPRRNLPLPRATVFGGAGMGEVGIEPQSGDRRAAELAIASSTGRVVKGGSSILGPPMPGAIGGALTNPAAGVALSMMSDGAAGTSPASGPEDALGADAGVARA